MVNARGINVPFEKNAFHVISKDNTQKFITIEEFHELQSKFLGNFFFTKAEFV